MNGLIGLALTFMGISGQLEHVENLLSDGRISSLGENLVEEIKNRHGVYQSGWASLSPLTVAKKGEDTPRLDMGTLANSFEVRVMSDPSGDGKALIIGSAEDTALWHELGYNNVPAGVTVPPRPVLLPTIFDNQVEITEVFGEVLVSLFSEAAASPGSLFGLEAQRKY